MGAQDDPRLTQDDPRVTRDDPWVTQDDPRVRLGFIKLSLIDLNYNNVKVMLK